MNIICEHCQSTLSSKYVLKNHLSTNKACLAIRNAEPEKTFKCKACTYVTTNNQKIMIHQETCKMYKVLSVKEDYQQELNKKDSIIVTLQESLKEKDCIINEYLQLKVRHEELKIRYDELSKQHEKTIEKLELKISQCDSFIQTLAREGSNKPTTTTNNTINNIRNHLSSTYTIDKLEPKTVEEIFREHYTEFDYYSGQKGLANFFLERVIKTPDGKMMICCTDTSRKKFKILDMKGNLKEDIEARVLCEKLKVPTEVVTKEMYDKIITRIDEERDRLSRDDRSRKEKLIDDSMRAQQVFIDNMNFDDINYNQDFMHELCVLLNV